MGVNHNGAIQRPSAAKRNATQRDKALSPHGHTARFLYLMLKQVDTKQINWQKVADGTGITTPASARNRYARFKRLVESQILGDMIQLKREQKEEGDEDTVESTGVAAHSSFNTFLNNTPANVQDTGADVRRRIKTEPGTTPIIQQEPGERSRHSYTNNPQDADMVDIDSRSTSPHTPSIKQELGLHYDFSDQLIKREVSVDDTPSSSFSNLSSHYYGSSSGMPCETAPNSLRSSPYQSTLASPSPLSSPYRPTVSYPFAQYVARSQQSQWGAFNSTSAAVHQRSPFYRSQDNHVQNSKPRKSRSGNVGKGSAEQPVDLDD